MSLAGLPDAANRGLLAVHPEFRHFIAEFEWVVRGEGLRTRVGVSAGVTATVSVRVWDRVRATRMVRVRVMGS